MSRAARARFAPAMNRAVRTGFTLIELLVAIGILAIVSILAWRGLSALIDTRVRLEPEAGEMRALVATLGQLEIDLARAPARPALFALAAPVVTVLAPDGAQVLRITRLADAPDGSGSDAVVVVQYRVLDGELVREHSAPRRAATGPAPVLGERERLLPRVAALRVRQWQPASGWVDAIAGVPGSDTAIEVTLRRADGTEVRRVLEVG
jgi:general secretion pathway protein J